jgi:hypothetical protein
MTQGNYPGQQPNTPGYGEGNQGYGPSAGQPAGGYGAPPGGYGAPADPYGTPTRREDTIGVVGIILAVIGIAAILVSFLTLKWTKGSGPNAKFSDLHDLFSGPTQGLNGLSDAYFSWLAWVLLIAVGLVALAANLPTPVSPALRGAGILLGLGGAVVTLFAIKLTSAISLSYAIKHGGVGYWVAIGGFVVAGIGAVIGPQRR